MEGGLLCEAGGLRMFMLRFDRGEAFMESLMEFSREEDLRGASIAGLGAFSSGELAFFNRATRQYDPIPVEEQVEVLNITGNIGRFEGEPKIHAHALLSYPDGRTIGGHLIDGVVWPTLELTVIESGTTLERTLDNETGLPLISSFK